MENQTLDAAKINAFTLHLRAEEHSAGTIEKYGRDISAFCAWNDGSIVTKQRAAEWKEHLLSEKYQPVTINSMLAALNSFFRYMKWENCMVKYLKIQRQLFRESAKELTRAEYNRLLDTAQRQGRNRLALLIETIFATGIRVSELRYITVEAAASGCTEVSLKGKNRTILIPEKLCRKLIKYSKNQKIASGEIFLTRSGRSLSRRQIWAEMKQLCSAAEVEASKVFPHNLRHLFARIFYQASHDVAKLADVLGHSSMETTRIYLISTSAEHARQIERLGLVS